MPPRKAAAAAPKKPTSGVTVTTTPPHAVFHNGEQRTGTLTGIDTATAHQWVRYGWATIDPDN